MTCCLIFHVWFCRCLVHALSFGAAHRLGIENGVPRGRWTRTRSICCASTKGPSNML